MRFLLAYVAFFLRFFFPSRDMRLVPLSLFAMYSAVVDVALTYTNNLTGIALSTPRFTIPRLYMRMRARVYACVQFISAAVTLRFSQLAGASHRKDT